MQNSYIKPGLGELHLTETQGYRQVHCLPKPSYAWSKQ